MEKPLKKYYHEQTAKKQNLISLCQTWKRHTMSVIKQKGESQNGCFKKAKHVNISEKINISYLLIRTGACAYQGVRNVCFSEILACFTFLKHPF